MKRKFSAELAYVLGIILIASGVAFMEKADFGVSMIVAPAYLIYRWISPTWSFFTFGMAEYCVQALLLLLMTVIIRQFRLSYLFSFVTAVVYGFVLDGFMFLCSPLPVDIIWFRLIYYVIGLLLCTAGVSAMFHTYISPEVYELFVKEVSTHFNLNITKFKIVYDFVSCLVGIALSFLIFGLWHFEGVSWGTIVCTLLNGFLIGRFSAFFEKHWTFYDRFPWRKFFEPEKAKPENAKPEKAGTEE